MKWLLNAPTMKREGPSQKEETERETEREPERDRVCVCKQASMCDDCMSAFVGVGVRFIVCVC